MSDDELRPKARGREAARKLRRGGGLLMRMGLVDPAARGKPDHAFRQPMSRKLRAHAVTRERLPISGGAGAPHLYEFPLMGT